MSYLWEGLFGYPCPHNYLTEGIEGPWGQDYSSTWTSVAVGGTEEDEMSIFAAQDDSVVHDGKVIYVGDNVWKRGGL